MLLFQLNLRDFIKASQDCIDFSHTIDLQNSNDETISFVRIEHFRTQEKCKTSLFVSKLVLYLCYTNAFDP
jgi:hypothetical protein